MVENNVPEYEEPVYRHKRKDIKLIIFTIISSIILIISSIGVVFITVTDKYVDPKGGFIILICMYLSIGSTSHLVSLHFKVK